MDFVKLRYINREGREQTGYVDLETGEGEEKHTGVGIKVEWSDERYSYIQVYDWEWEFDWEGTPHRKSSD